MSDSEPEYRARVQDWALIVETLVTWAGNPSDFVSHGNSERAELFVQVEHRKRVQADQDLPRSHHLDRPRVPVFNFLFLAQIGFAGREWRHSVGPGRVMTV